MEEWRDIEGYDGKYQVSNYGRVRSLKYHSVRILRQGVKERGYHFVILCSNSIKKNFHVHRLVAEEFIPNPNGYTTVHHKDHDRGNNVVENLEWINDDEHREVHGIVGGKVYQYTLDGELVKLWDCMHSAAVELGFNKSHIRDCCNGGYYDRRRDKWVRVNTYKGFIWSYTPLTN